VRLAMTLEFAAFPGSVKSLQMTSSAGHDNVPALLREAPPVRGARAPLAALEVRMIEIFRREPFPRVVRHDAAALQREKTQPNTGASVCPIVSQ